MERLIIGDTHLEDKYEGLLVAQCEALIKIYDEALKAHPELEEVVFMGDLTMHRRPSPKVLLWLKQVIDHMSRHSRVVMLRGNHDSQTKADDGVTALSLFDSEVVKTYTHTEQHDETKSYYIPHYEDEEAIKTDLAACPKDYAIFGHFGYFGALNSAGDNDFSIAVDDFPSNSVVGHIHTYGQTDTKRGHKLIRLGTPYPTSFSEGRKDSFYGILSQTEEDPYSMSIYPVSFGPRFLTVAYDTVGDNLEFINDPHYFTILRIVFDTLEEVPPLSEILEGVNVHYVETKFKPLVDTKEEFVTTSTEDPITELTDEIIDSYINCSNTSISKQTLLDSLQIIYENQQGRDQ